MRAKVRAKQLDIYQNQQTEIDKNGFPSLFVSQLNQPVDRSEQMKYDTNAEAVVRFESSPRYSLVNGTLDAG
jgi:hypothetical protein